MDETQWIENKKNIYVIFKHCTLPGSALDIMQTFAEMGVNCIMFFSVTVLPLLIHMALTRDLVKSVTAISCEHSIKKVLTQK